MEEKIQALREKLTAIMKKHGYSQARVARSLGFSGGALSAWLSGTYKGDNEQVAEAVRGYLRLETERQQKRRTGIPFTETSISEKIFKAARICHVEGEVGVAYGLSGIGKTYAVKQYAALNQDVILIEADNGYTAKDLFAELTRTIGEYASSINEMKNTIISKLKDSGRLIIVDEAENLPFKAIDLLRRVHDKAGVGVLFVGINRLYESLISKRTIYAYVLSRIGVVARLEPLTQDDVKKIVHEAIPESGDLARTFYDISRGNARTASKLIFRSEALANENGVAITPEIIRQAGKGLFI